MKGYNLVTLIGNVGQDPEVNETGDGTKVANVSIATSPPWNDDIVEWHRVVFWDKQAEIIERYVSKGDRIHVSGRLSYDKWEDKSGSKRTTAQIRVDDFTLLGGGKRGSATKGQVPQSARQTEISDDDLPF